MRASELAAMVARAKEALHRAKEDFDAALRRDAHWLTPQDKLDRWETFLAEQRSACSLLWALRGTGI